MSSRRSERTWLPRRSVSPYQAYALMFGTVVGVGTLIFPRTMAKEVGTDGILVIPLVGLMAGFMIFLISKLGARFPGMSLVGITREVLRVEGKTLAGEDVEHSLLHIFRHVLGDGHGDGDPDLRSSADDGGL